MKKLFAMLSCALLLAGCGGGSGGGSGGTAPNNKTTLADAGPAQNVVAGSLVTLDGSQSTGADGSLITYQWSIVSIPVGSVARINNSTAVNPNITTDLSGQYTLKLIVTDSKLIVSEDTITVTVTASNSNSPPVANAGLAQNIVTGTVVILDGTSSSDANSDLLTYSWGFASKPNGSNSALSNSTAAKPTFTPDIAGAYVFNLIVNDGKVNSAAAIVTITATIANAAPVANVGAAQNVVTGALVTLDSSGSSDANGDMLTYRWDFTSKPAGSSAALSSSTVAKPTFIPDVTGAYVLNLVVNDGKINSNSASTTITSIPAPSCSVNVQQYYYSYPGVLSFTFTKIMRPDPELVIRHELYPSSFPEEPIPEAYIKLVVNAVSGTPYMDLSDISILQDVRMISTDFKVDMYGADSGYPSYSQLQPGIISISYLRLSTSANSWFNPSTTFTINATPYLYISPVTSISCSLW